MDLFKLTFLVLFLVGPFYESDAFAFRGDEQFLRSTIAVCVEEEADAPKQDPSPSEHCRLIHRPVKRKPGSFVLSLTAQSAPLSITGHALSCLYCSNTVDQDDLHALYRFLRVYRC